MKLIYGDKQLHIFCRCGGSFCKQCTSYKRHLNSSGNFDPAGRLYKVLQVDDRCRYDTRRLKLMCGLIHCLICTILIA